MKIWATTSLFRFCCSRVSRAEVLKIAPFPEKKKKKNGTNLEVAKHFLVLNVVPPPHERVQGDQSLQGPHLSLR